MLLFNAKIVEETDLWKWIECEEWWLSITVTSTLFGF